MISDTAMPLENATQPATAREQPGVPGRLPRPLIAAMLAQFATTGAVLPFVTLWLRDRGLAYDRISLLLLAASSTMLVFPFFWGMLADRYLPLNRLFILLNVLGVGALAAMAMQRGFTGLLIAFTGYAACMNPTFALTNALAFHHLRSPRQQFGRLRAWGSLGWILPFLPIALWTAIQPAAGLDFILYLGMGLGLGMAGLSLRLPHTPPRAKIAAGGQAMKPLYLPAARRLLTNVDYLVVLAAMFLMAGSFSLAMYYSPPFLETLGVARPWIGPIQAIGVLFEIVLFQLQPALLRRWNYTAVILVGCACLAFRHLLFRLVDEVWALSASYLLTGAVIVFFHMGVSVLVNALAEVEVRATAQTLLAFFGLGLGPMVANWFAGRLAARAQDDLHPVFLLGAVLAMLAALLIAVRGRRLNEAGRLVT